ncbi:uncharacterized protein A4U43_C01F34320 [Asparagus officinalis]|uniref:Folate-biopterin transporter 2 n=1 Tax=Asparagus officinalis TaxID=4686 RepID=A0A5P1FV76_ASPOF|nr:probable folate-biopterin transporter 2 [Asparagus officinalis]ONK81924.1 uncharacterized protein A4U43_C01F34320 [Asparagus officinalis]
MGPHDGEENEATELTGGEDSAEKETSEEERSFKSFLSSPLVWFTMLVKELHWSFVFGVFIIYGVSQGVGWSVWRVAADYYWKDVQLKQPSQAQVYQGITNIPWIVKPIWGLLTDVLPMAGYRRRPYFLFSGFLGIISMLTLSLHKQLHVLFALLAMTAGSAGVAIADVTIDACVAQKSITHPHLAADMQSLCGLCSSIGSLLGYSISGLLVHAVGPQGVLGLLSIPSALVFTVGMVMKEAPTPKFEYNEVCEKFLQANRTMWTTLKCPAVWRPCLYMYISFALSLNIQEGMFFWYTDPKAGPPFSQETIGFIFAVGSIGGLLGVVLYQNVFKDHAFRGMLLWSQVLSCLAGMLDLVLVFRLNLKLRIPDFFFGVVDESVSQLIGKLKWMPLLVLSTKLCPSGIEGTFFALLMSIDNFGLLTSSWGGGLLLHILHVTRTDFGNLGVAILIRNLMRLLPLTLILLVPKSEPDANILPVDMLVEKIDNSPDTEVEDIELVSLVGQIQRQ